MPFRLTRRRFVKLLLGGAASAALSACGGAGYATLVEPRWLTVERVDIPLPGLPAALDGFTLAQLSDLHRGPWVTPSDIAHAVELTLRQRADLIVLTGDYVSRSAEYAASCAETLAALAASGRATFACLGNHDHWTHAGVVSGALAEAGVVVLRNAAREAADGLWIAAVDDVWERHADLEKALADAPVGATVVLLAHEPDYADVAAADGRVGLQLSGHSHGGQVRTPFGEALVLPYLAQKYYAGRYRIGRMELYVNRGVGRITPPVRFNCRPEVTLLTLRSS